MNCHRDICNNRDTGLCLASGGVCSIHKLSCMRNLTRADSNVVVVPIITLENVMVFTRKMWVLPSPRKRGSRFLTSTGP